MRIFSKPQNGGETSLSYRKDRNVLRLIAARLHNRPDSEHEMSYNRLFFTIAILTYVLVPVSSKTNGDHFLVEYASIILGAYMASSVALFLHILWKPAQSPMRRIAAIVLDTGTVTFLIAVGNAETACLYPLLLWTIFGNGFRFGLPYLICASVMSLAGFTFVIFYNKFWSTYISLSIGLMIGLIVLPGYAAVLIQKLSKAKQQAEAASLAKSAFLASMSHELRTPLNSVIGLADLLSDTKLDADQADMSRTISASGRILLSLINNVLDHSRLEIGKMPKSVSPLDLHSTAQQVISMLHVQASAKGLDLTLQIGHDVPRWVLANKNHLSEVLINLTGNAIKFTESGYVFVRVSKQMSGTDTNVVRFEVIDSGIGISAEAQQHIFESFTQADHSILDRFGGTGLGLSLARQMVQLYGGDLAVESSPGTGSNFFFHLPFDIPENASELASAQTNLTANASIIVCSQDAELMTLVHAGGQQVFFAADEENGSGVSSVGKPDSILLVDYDAYKSSPEDLDKLLAGAPQGTRILAGGAEIEWLDTGIHRKFCTVIRKPLTPDSLSQALSIASGFKSGATHMVQEPAIKPSGNRYRILVAEDNDTNKKVIGRILGNAGFASTIVSNGQELLETLSANTFDLVLMDINMPVINGIEATKLYHFSCTGKTPVPIFALTADVTEETRAKCLDAGMLGCISKPIEGRELIRLIEDTLHGKVVEPQGKPLNIEATSANSHDDADHKPVSSEVRAEPVDLAALNDLFVLGGKDFVDEIVHQFVLDASSILAQVARAVASEDAHAFSESAHALRSCAANVGARRIYELCLAWRELSAAELARMGEIYVRTLEQEFACARVELEKLIEAADASSGFPQETQANTGRGQDGQPPLRKAG